MHCLTPLRTVFHSGRAAGRARPQARAPFLHVLAAAGRSSTGSGHSAGCEAIPRRGFQSHLPDDWRRGASLRVSLGRLCVLFGKRPFRRSEAASVSSALRRTQGAGSSPSRQPLPGGTSSMTSTSVPPGSGASLWSRFEKKRPRKLKTDLSPGPVPPTPGPSQDTAVLEEPPPSRCHLK